MIVEKFDTEEKALEAIGSERYTDIDWFCPLINDTCYNKCVCFLPAHVDRGGYAKAWYAYGASCNNQMFFRE
jgi:hypothetical protein